ncbi:MAG: hypothetical protein U0792_04935 [Gemmataceae bacterium]
MSAMSRCYRIRDGQAEQLTFDHSWVWGNRQAAGRRPRRTRRLQEERDYPLARAGRRGGSGCGRAHPLQPGDAFLLCSDGLTGPVHPTEIGAVVNVMPLDEASRLLVHLANLRGGPDNITVVIVRVPGGAADDDADKKASGPGFLKRAFTAWNKMVPWPYTTLGIGSLLAILSLLLRMSETPGAVPLFLLAAIIILAGLIGLVLDMKKEEADDPTPEDDKPRVLNIHKRHDCSIRRRPGGEVRPDGERTRREHERPGCTPPTGQPTRSCGAPPGPPASPESPTAFRARCESLLFIADAF